MTDLGVRMLRDGYRAVERDRRERGGGPTYRSRLLGRCAVVLAGRPGARLFYDEGVVERSGAVPAPLSRLLFGRGAVHGLDGEEHRRRKQLFLDLLGHQQVARCAADAGDRLLQLVGEWSGREVEPHAQLVQVYGQAVLAWAGIECPPEEAARMSRWYADIVDGFGFAGRAYARGWRGRHRTEAWAERLIGGVREGGLQVRPGSVLEAVAQAPLDLHTAAVELGNVLRPTIAVAWLGTFAAWQLGQVPQWRDRLADPADASARLSFAQEVRRTTPFVPALTGRVRQGVTHEGLHLRAGDRVVLDVRGINLDPDLHHDPLVFRPDRFLDHAPGAFDLVPQGGGFPDGHRCPGESLALQLLAETVRVLAGAECDVVSTPDLDLRRMPTLPAGLRLRVVAASLD